MNYPTLNECKEITYSQYLDLKDPEFIAQTRADDNFMYWMIFKSESILYKIHNKLTAFL